jgi:hypothetical protein
MAYRSIHRSAMSPEVRRDSHWATRSRGFHLKTCPEICCGPGLRRRGSSKKRTLRGSLNPPRSSTVRRSLPVLTRLSKILTYAQVCSGFRLPPLLAARAPRDDFWTHLQLRIFLDSRRESGVVDFQPRFADVCSRRSRFLHRHMFAFACLHQFAARAMNRHLRARSSVG